MNLSWLLAAPLSAWVLLASFAAQAQTPLSKPDNLSEITDKPSSRGNAEDDSSTLASTAFGIERCFLYANCQPGALKTVQRVTSASRGTHQGTVRAARSIESDVDGSGELNGPASADVTLNLRIDKNPGANDGEIEPLILGARNYIGDAAGLLANVGTTKGASYILEGTSFLFNPANSRVINGVDVQLGVASNIGNAFEDCMIAPYCSVGVNVATVAGHMSVAYLGQYGSTTSLSKWLLFQGPAGLDLQVDPGGRVTHTGGVTETFGAGVPSGIAIPGSTYVDRSAAAGTPAKYLYQASGNWQAINPSMVAFSPTISSNDGRLGGYTVQASYRQIGNVVEVQYEITVTSAGSAAGNYLKATLPVPGVAANSGTLNGEEDTKTGKAVWGIADVSTCRIRNADNSSPIQTGSHLVIRGSYNAAL